MRRLIYIAIVHSETDLGSLTDALRKRYIDRVGLSGWRERVKGIDALWQEIRRTVLALDIDYQKLKVYQDGLPVCGRELEIVRDLARQGSENHRLLLELRERGATIMGTEDTQLLVEEYLRLRDGLEGDNKTVDRLSPTEDTLSRRDLYIARRVRETLGEDEIGLLFIGLLHRVDEQLNQDMEITYLFKEWQEVKEDKK
jgi:hypothetical protein